MPKRFIPKKEDNNNTIRRTINIFFDVKPPSPEKLLDEEKGLDVVVAGA
jgi:hypothetical protein